MCTGFFDHGTRPSSEGEPNGTADGGNANGGAGASWPFNELSDCRDEDGWAREASPPTGLVVGECDSLTKSSKAGDRGESGVENSAGATDGRRKDEKLDRFELVDEIGGSWEIECWPWEPGWVGEIGRREDSRTSSRLVAAVPMLLVLRSPPLRIELRLPPFRPRRPFPCSSRSRRSSLRSPSVSSPGVSVGGAATVALRPDTIRLLFAATDEDDDDDGRLESRLGFDKDEEAV